MASETEYHGAAASQAFTLGIELPCLNDETLETLPVEECSDFWLALKPFGQWL